MEDNLQKTLNQIMSSTPNCTGVLFADKNGLCLGAKGISKDSAGIAAALSEQACHLEADANSPIICLQSGNKRITQRHQGVNLSQSCIQQEGTVEIYCYRDIVKEKT
ncbi:hypothetical protein ACFFRR_001713 [Megaselia abdita]